MSSENNDSSGKFEFPYQINLLDEERTKNLMRDFIGEQTRYVQVGPKKYFFPCRFVDGIKNIYNFQVRKDDVWIITFPRSGTTVTQEIVWLLCNNLNFEKAVQVPLVDRMPFLEFTLCANDDVKAEVVKLNNHNAKKLPVLDDPMWNVLHKVKGRRFIKTHLPFSLLPPNLLTSGCKIIYVARNPQDVSVSYYHLNRLFRKQGFQSDWKTYWEYFTNNLEIYSPYWEHVKEGYEQQANPNVLFMFYEEINRNLQGSLHKLAKFFDVSLTSSDIKKLEEHLNIENFRKNKSVNFDVLVELGIFKNSEEGFIRQGKVGGSKKYFDEELTKKYNDWIEYNKEKVFNLEFPL